MLDVAVPDLEVHAVAGPDDLAHRPQRRLHVSDLRLQVHTLVLVVVPHYVPLAIARDVGPIRRLESLYLSLIAPSPSVGFPPRYSLG